MIPSGQDGFEPDEGLTDEPLLPAHAAFVVQLGRVRDPDEFRFVGRLEHILSGRQARFSSQAEMIEAIRRLLQETDPRD